MESTKHVPVLLKEVVKYLAVKKGAVVVDATLGGGGYARVLLEGVGEQGQVIAFDVDSQAIERVRSSFSGNLPRNLILEKANFSDIREVLEKLSIKKVDAIVADLGFSSDQMEDARRGFSFMQEGPLDMRLDQSAERSAKDILARADEKELTELFFRSDEPEARRIARAVVTARQEKPLQTTRELAELIEEVYPKKKTLRLNSGRLVLRSSRIHPATRTFQALRMEVNREIEHLRTFLETATQCLKPGGRLAIVAFHSGEDRLVKHFFRKRAKGCICPENFPQCVCGETSGLRIITKKPIMPEEQEEKRNPRSRSATLRVAEKV